MAENGKAQGAIFADRAPERALSAGAGGADIAHPLPTAARGLEIHMGVSGLLAAQLRRPWTMRGRVARTPATR